MPRLAKCPYCNKEIQKNEPVKKYQNKSYHLSCYQKYCDEVYKKQSSTTDNNSQQQLYDYICKLFNIDELTPFLNFQLQKIFKENNFTYDGVLYTLKYFYEVHENPINEQYGIGIVPLMYDKAKNFYHKKFILWEKNSKVQLKKEVKTVKVKQEEQTKKPLIDISKL